MEFLFHLFQSDGFEPTLSPESLETEGFVHLSNSDQLLRTANRWFREATKLKVMVLGADQLQEHLKWEDLYERGEEFPHLYAPIPRAAVAAVVELGRDEEGAYRWPECLNGLVCPLLEPLSAETAVIEPARRFPEKKLPSKCVLCFFSEVLDSLEARQDCRRYRGLGSEIGATDVFTLSFEDEEITVCHPGVGGSLAAATLEELIALGCREFFLCGGAGSLISEQSMGQLVLVSQAWRDEGASHHYLAPSQILELDRSLVQSARQTLDRLDVSYQTGCSWTTDGLYRETPSRVARRREAGCLTVEMEVASLAAVARYRGCRFGALLYCGDDVGSEQWDFREWTSATSVRERLFWVGVEVLRGLES